MSVEKWLSSEEKEEEEDMGDEEEEEEEEEGVTKGRMQSKKTKNCLEK